VNDPAYTALFGPYAARHLAIYVHDKEHQHDHDHHECCGDEEHNHNG
jgi:zinc transport system ATP-binding protein